MSAALAVERHTNADAFLAAAESWLLEAEAENNLLLGIALNWHGRAQAGPPPYWASVRDGGRIVGCACRTPPHLLVVSRLPAAATSTLVEDVGAAYPSLNGVSGPAADAEGFARAWVALHGGTSRMRCTRPGRGLSTTTRSER